MRLWLRWTLRKQVQEYVKFTRRIPITQDFFPSADEQKLYDEVSEYLRRGELMALPKSQRQLITLVLRKLLASSTFAISGTLRHLAVRLQKELDGDQDTGEASDSAADFEALDELVDEWDADGEPPPEDQADPSEVRNRKIKSEIRELRGFVKLAEGIQRNLSVLYALTSPDPGVSLDGEIPPYSASPRTPHPHECRAPNLRAHRSPYPTT